MCSVDRKYKLPSVNGVSDADSSDIEYLALFFFLWEECVKSNLKYSTVFSFKCEKECSSWSS